ncbi:tetratricopeptide repeat protein [Lacinutrix sp.]|uniref:tetratricopeptide repeat protein n=1 Tax=Lacinutrix sp. TaxID=1937692 RepID=UPI0025B8DE12|nr:tetratricopeptide repeat protein [Lacinutrix sp.]
MKKQLILSLALFVTLFSFAQKKELKTLEKAVKSNNFAEAKTTANQLESMLGSMDDKMKSKFYFNRAKALYANGTGNIADFDTAISDLSKVDEKHVDNIGVTINNIQNELLVKANKLYTAGKYAQASSYFLMLYKLVPKDESYLYYAAVSSVQAQDFDSALKHYKLLKDIGYTGVVKEYFAINKETGVEEIYEKSTRDLYVNRAKSHISPGERMSESKAAEIAKQIALIYVSQDKNEKALEAIKDARAADSSNSDLILTEANVQYKLGNIKEYGKLIEEAVSNDPNNVSLLYNLGVISFDSGKLAEARAYYKNALKIDTTHSNAALNLSTTFINEGNSLNEKLNSLGNSAADNAKYDKLKIDKSNLFKSGAEVLETFISNNPKANSDIGQQLYNIYIALGSTEKANAIKTKFGL